MGGEGISKPVKMEIRSERVTPRTKQQLKLSHKAIHFCFRTLHLFNLMYVS